MRGTGSKYRGGVGSQRAEEDSLRVYRTLFLSVSSCVCVGKRYRKCKAGKDF